MRQSSHPIAAFKSNVVAVLQSIMPVLYCIVTDRYQMQNPKCTVGIFYFIPCWKEGLMSSCCDVCSKVKSQKGFPSV